MSGITDDTLPTMRSDELELVFLGTGNAFSMSGRYWGSILVNEHILLDASPVVVPHMKKLGRELSKLQKIFLTHFHADHFLGLPFILLDYAYLTTMEHPLTIIGPTGVEDLITHITEIGFSGVTDKLKGKLEINYVEVTKPGQYSVSGLDFTAYPMAHGVVEAYGYKLVIGDKILGYTGDTGPCDGLIELAQDLDILIIEMSNPHDDVPGHMSLAKLEQCQEYLGPTTKIILNHVGEITGELPSNNNLILPHDLEVLKF
ncbi:MBL fold metallo-hydrolase [[Eubacterium] cellulosolvens]